MLLLFRPVFEDLPPRLPIGDPVCRDRGACHEQFLGNCKAMQRGQLMPAIALGPSHADPALLTQFPAEGGRNAADPAIGTRREPRAIPDRTSTPLNSSH